ncbi:beta-ketoacyl synthase N-terminal-like domain-containing protein [Actinophytocola sp. NPDC049390]|uniref:beta-ketoacyl synthase N-terminal-like domain-containing protein n=1 Tax=Actinophytocola sp. NPDC049390 TaxID=3363894 RepID=UPI0037A2A993
MTDEETDRDTHIAVVGMAGRFAGAPNLDAYWELLVSGGCAVRELDRAELLAAGEEPARMADPAYVHRYGRLDRPEWFDADFFGYAPVDATLTDPQHRVFLETCWQALEDAGYPPSDTGAVVGVYAGCSPSRYWSLVGRDADRFPGLDDVRMAMVTGADHLCLRVSHKLGLTGPSMTVLSTCSTALVAVHQATQSLLFGDCDMALAGAVSVRMPALGGLARAGSVLSADGVCRAFDAKANGTVFGDGVGVVVLKRYADAVADGDHVHAVIRGSAVNNDGRDRVGYGAPGVAGQTAVIRAALAAADVDPADIGYVESHGTGTPVGDPIEVTALTRAFGDVPRGRTVLGTVKPNIGHTDAAAGIAGLLKVILALRHGVLPPAINVTEPNPAIDFAATPFVLPAEPTPWERRGSARLAGISSFGIGATNVHLVVEEPPTRLAGAPPAGQRLLLLSARTPVALDEATAALADHLDAHPEVSLDDVAHTLRVGRVAFPYRRFAVVTDHADAVRVLRGHEPGRVVTGGTPVHGTSGEPVDAHGEEPAELGRRWLAGQPLRGQRAGRRVPLPTYPFQRQPFVAGLREPGTPEPAPTPQPPAAAAPVVDAEWTRDEIVETIALLFAEVLLAPEVAPDDDFFELGGDSLIAVGLLARLEEAFGVSPPPEELFAAPTPAEFAVVVAELLEDPQ